MVASVKVFCRLPFLSRVRIRLISATSEIDGVHSIGSPLKLGGVSMILFMESAQLIRYQPWSRVAWSVVKERVSGSAGSGSRGEMEIVSIKSHGPASELLSSIKM